MTPIRSTRRRRIAQVIGALLVPVAFAGMLLTAIAPDADGSGRIPAAIVNEDEAIIQTGADGEEQYVLAGRLLVTQLTGDGSTGFDWSISSAEQAEDALATGQVRAVLTIPEDFSASIVSLSSSSPQRAQLRIRTDESQDALTALAAAAVGEGMVAEFGQAITEQYLAGVFGQVGSIGDAFSEAATGAAGIGDGAASLAGGVSELHDGLASLSTGVGEYTAGVSALAGGLDQLKTGAQQLDGLTSGVGAYTGGVTQLSGALDAAVAQLQANPTDPVALGTVQALAGQLATLAAGGSGLTQQTGTAIAGVQSGIAQSASGARSLASGGTDLRSGTTSAADGAAQLAEGAGSLAEGAQVLAGGLAAGADAIPSTEGAAAEDAAAVAARPVELTADRENPLPDLRAAALLLTLPLGLWLGAMTVQVLSRNRAVTESLSTTPVGRMLRARLTAPLLFAGAQALLLALLAHVATGIGWNLFPATLGFALLAAVAFAAVHHLLATLFGRGAVVLSLLLLAVQLTATGGVFPLQLVAEPFQAISPVLPLTHAVAGIQSIASGGSATAVVTAAIALALFAIGSLLVSALVLRSRRASDATAARIAGVALAR